MVYVKPLIHWWCHSAKLHRGTHAYRFLEFLTQVYFNVDSFCRNWYTILHYSIHHGVHLLPRPSHMTYDRKSVNERKCHFHTSQPCAASTLPMVGNSVTPDDQGNWLYSRCRIFDCFLRDCITDYMSREARWPAVSQYGFKVQTAKCCVGVRPLNKFWPIWELGWYNIMMSDLRQLLEEWPSQYFMKGRSNVSSSSSKSNAVTDYISALQARFSKEVYSFPTLESGSLLALDVRLTEHPLLSHRRWDCWLRISLLNRLNEAKTWFNLWQLATSWPQS